MHTDYNLDGYDMALIFFPLFFTNLVFLNNIISMKKILFILLTCLCFISCNKPSEIKIDNKSSYEVKFSQGSRPSDVITVAAGKTVYIQAINTAFPDIAIKSSNISVKTCWNGEFNISFVNFNKKKLHVVNKTDSVIQFKIKSSCRNNEYESEEYSINKKQGSDDTKEDFTVFFENSSIICTHANYSFNTSEMILTFNN